MSEEQQPEVQDLSKVIESINALGESLSGINDRINGFEEKFSSFNQEQEPVTPVTPVSPEEDPENLPPQDWKSLRKEIEEKAVNKAKELLESEKEAQKAAEEEDKKNAEELDKYFDGLADQAVEKGFIPAIEDQDNPEDPGKVARRELFGYAAKLGTTNLVDIAETLSNLHAIGKHFDVKTGKIIQSEYIPEGKTVPVGSSANRSGSVSNKISAKTFKQASLDTLARLALDN